MADETEGFRRVAVAAINSAVQSDEPDPERKRLEAEYGQVWDTEQLSKDFSVEGFMAPFCVVSRKSDGVKGSIMFQHRPRFYFSFTPA